MTKNIKNTIYAILSLSVLATFIVLLPTKQLGFGSNIICSNGGLGFVGRLGNFICNTVASVVDNSLPISMTIFLSESGQSNSIGSGATPVINSSSLYARNFFWNNTATTTLIETSVETQSSAYGNSLSFAESGRGSVHDRWGVGGTAFTLLRPGSTNFNNAQAEQLEAMNLFGADICAGPLIWIHGETDGALRSTSTYYLNELLNLQNGWDASTTLNVGSDRRCRAEAMPLIYNSLANWTNSGEGSYDYAPEVADAQSRGTILYPDRLWQAYPAYIVQYQSDNEHYTNLGAELSGEYMARAAARWIAGESFAPLKPSSITCDNNIITLTTTGGIGSSCLTFDTSTLAMRPHYGFTYRNSAASTTPSAQVTSAAVTGCNTIQVTLDQSCTSDGYLQYAWNAIPLSSSLGRTSTSSFSAGGNVRNQDTSWTHSRLGYTLPDFLIPFDRQLDSCTNCSSLPTYTFSNLYGITTDNSPVEFLSCSNIPSLLGVTRLTVAGLWRVISGSGTWSSAQSVLYAQNFTSQRTIDVRGTTLNRLQVYFPTSVTDGATFWTAATNTFFGESEEGIVVSYDGAGGATNADKVHIYHCTSSTCRDVTAAGFFTGTVSSTLPTTGRADFSFGASSGGGTANMATERRVGQVAIWNNIAFSAAGVDQWWNGGRLIDPRTHTSGTPQHYWPFQPETGFRDIVGGENCRPFGANTGVVPLWTPRYIFSLPEAGDYVTFPGSGSSTANSAITYDGWIRCTGTPSINRVFHGRSSGGEVRNSATTSFQLRPVFNVGTNTSTQNCFSSDDEYPTSTTWRRFTMTFDEALDPGGASTTAQRNQSMADMYVNGALDDFETCSDSALMSIPDDGSPGNYIFNEAGDGTDGMACQYSNLAMYNRRLTSTEISNISFSTNRLTHSASSSLTVWSGPFPGDHGQTWRNAASTTAGIVTGILNSSTDMLGWTGP